MAEAAMAMLEDTDKLRERRAKRYSDKPQVDPKEEDKKGKPKGRGKRKTGK